MRHARLVYNRDKPDYAEFTFVERATIGRRRGYESERERRVIISDPRVSGRHCVIRQGADGRFFIRDESRNGTRIDGRRLLPNVEMELQPGQRVAITQDHILELEVEPDPFGLAVDDDESESTQAVVAPRTEVTILVGDIRGYTTLNQQYPPERVYPSVKGVFSQLEEVVSAHLGTIKEYQGDAIFAFWESVGTEPRRHALQACKCALEMHRTVTRQLANDPGVWALPEYPLQMDWALTTGRVLISTLGGDRPTALAMVGDAVNYAFRLEKLAGDEHGPIVACRQTWEMAKDAFAFEALGDHQVKGRLEADAVYALLGPRT